MTTNLLGMVNWTSMGAAPINNGQTTGIASGPNPVNGAINAIAASPASADVLFAGSTNGGVWRTTNATAANPTWTGVTDQFSGSAIGALQYDPTDGANNTLVAAIGRRSSFNGNGGLQTGILRTTDGGNTWTSLGSTDLAGRNLTAVAPRGATILVSAINGGPGVYRSIDTGLSFQNISGLNGLGNGAARDLARDPTNNNRLYVSVLGVGVFRTDNLGNSWTGVSSGDAALNAAITGAGNNNIRMSVATNGRIFVGVTQNGVVTYIGYSDNQGGSWTQMDLPISLEQPVAISNATNASPIVITSNNHGLNNGAMVRIGGILGNTAANGDWTVTVINTNSFSLDGSNGNGAYGGGGTWRLLSPLQPEEEEEEESSSQGATHFSLLADPTNPNTVYIGGDLQDNPGGFPNSLGANNFTGRLFRGDTTVAAVAPGSQTNAFSPQWEHLTNIQNQGFAGGGTANNSAPHADSRVMVFNTNNELIEGDDGGIYRRTSPSDNTGDWFGLFGSGATGLQVTEMHDIVYDNNSNVVISGNQDNGVGLQSSSGSLVWTQHPREGGGLFQGDGGDVVVDNLVGGGNSLRYLSTQNLGNFRRITVDGANTVTNVATPALTLAGVGPVPQAAPQFKFVTPLAVNNVVANRLIIGGVNGAFESTDNGDNITRISTAEVNGQNGGTGSTGNAIVYGGRRGGVDNADVLYIGVGSQVFARTATTFGGLTATAALPAGVGMITDVEIDPNDWMRVYACDTDQVFFSPDGGATWTDITGNLTDVNLRSLKYIPGTGGGSDVLVVGGNLGVYKVVPTLPGVWTELGLNLPNAPVWDIDYDQTDDVLVVGTLGRGSWAISNASTVVDDQPVLVVCGDSQFANQDDTIRLVRNSSNPALLDVFVNGLLEFEGPIGAILQINIFAAGGNDDLIVDSTNGLINLPSGIRYDGDHGCDMDGMLAGIGGFDRLDLIQAGGPTLVSDELAPAATPGAGRSRIVDDQGNVQVVDFQYLEPVVDTVPSPSFNVAAIPGLASVLQASNAINYGPALLIPPPAGTVGGRVTIDNFEPIEFANKVVLVISAGAGSDAINLNNPTTPTGLTKITINGDDPTAGSDTVIVNGTPGVDAILVNSLTINGAMVTGAQPVPVMVDTTEHLIIDGQGGGDSLTHTSPDASLVDYFPGRTVGAGAIFAQRNSSLLDVGFEDLGASSAVTFASNSGARANRLAYYGTVEDDVFNVSAAGLIQLGRFPSTTIDLDVNAIGISQLVLLGLDGDDSFNVPGNHPFIAGVTAQGGNPDDGSDVLNFNGAGATITADLGSRRVSEGGFVPVSFTGMETVNIVAATAALIAALTTNDDELTYRPTGITAGTFQNVGDNTTFNFSGVAGAFTVNGLASVADLVTVLGTNGRDRILVDSPNRTVTVTNAAGTALKAVALAADVENLSVQGLNGNDTFLVVPAPTVGPIAGENLLINVDGGQPGASDALVIATATGGTLPATDFAVNAVGLNPGEGRVRVYRGAVAMPDISYSNTEIVSPNVVVTAGAPQLLVLGPDSTESNEFRTTATHLGAGQSINVDNLAIFPDATEHPNVPADVDFFQIVAKDTGTLDVTVFFEIFPTSLLPGGGQLGVNVLDAAGNVIGGAGTFGNPSSTPNERVRIPVVAGHIYFVQVFGATGAGAADPNVVNGYELTITNTPPPVPHNLELLDNPVGDPPPANVDTGRSQFDNVTRDNTPTIVFRVDDAIFLNDLPGNNVNDTPPDEVIPIPFQAAAGSAGYRIAIFDEGSSPAPGTQTGTAPQTPLGFATFVSPGVYQFTTPVLTDGTHFLTARVQMVDPATPQQTGFGDRSVALEVIVDTVIPAGFFGQLNLADITEGMSAANDSGVDGDSATFVERVTNDTRPSFYGRSEANAIVRVYAETNGVAGLQSTGAGADLFLGLTVANPLDGTNQFPGGQWSFTTPLDLNNPNLGFAHDGARSIYMTAEDLAGNVTADAAADLLNIFLDTAGAQVTDVQVTGSPLYNLFGLKPDNSIEGPTPRVNSLTIRVQDLPSRSNVDPNFLYAALQQAVATTPGNFVLKGDHSGIIAIQSITFLGDPTGNGAIATGSILLNFFAPLPDDRYTLTIKENVVDPAGNKLDGESNAAEPIGNPSFASGDGQPGGDFVARFTVDSRPEIGSISEGLVYVDINGNMVWDPEGQDNDATNRDFTFQFGQLVDAHFSGNFAPTGAAVASGFDKLGAYGKFGGKYSFILDTNDDGVGDFSSLMPAAYQVNGSPVAGNFNAAHPGDEIGLFDGSFWYLDTNGNNQIDLGEKFASNFNGLPVVGDFNGDGKDDLAVFVNDTNKFIFDTNRDGIADFTWNVADQLGRFGGFSGFTDRPVAGDLNLDGIDDIGLWAKDRQGTLPRNSGEFFFWVSDRANANPANVFDSYSPSPLGNDLSAEFGDELALPVFGNFDPPVTTSTVDSNPLHRTLAPLDINGDGVISPVDALLVINVLNNFQGLPTNDPVRAYFTIGQVKADASGDRGVTPLDALLVINALNRKSNLGGEGEGEASGSLAPADQHQAAADHFFAQLGDNDVLESMKKKRR